MQPREKTIKPSVPKDISSWTHVFLRKDAVKAPLTPPYTGPYRVLSRTDKPFTLDISGKKATVSIDRVKRAFLNTNSQEPPTYTHEHILTPVEKIRCQKTITSPPHVVVDEYIGQKNSVKLFIYKMYPSLFYGCYLFLCWLSA